MPVSNPPTQVSTEALRALVENAGFKRFGFARLETPVSMAFYESWLDRGYQGEMDYLVRHLPEKRAPEKLMPRALSAIVVGLDYLPHPAPAPHWPLKADGLTVATYARGFDYHHVLKKRLEDLIEQLREKFPEGEFRSFTDSSPVLERDLAKRAGLGWVGKNTCLIQKGGGSLFFLAEIYTSLEIPVAVLETPDHCGTCTRCIDACPTGALVEPRVLDARKCISYLTIESRRTPPLEFREKIGGWFYGCDICQTVCPWNVKFHGKEPLAALTQTSAENLFEDLKFVLASSNRALEKAFAGTALSRAGGWGLKRNAIVVAANLSVQEAIPLIEPYTSHEKLGELAAWALKRLRSVVSPA